MDFRVDEDQIALQEGIRSFCEGRVGIDQIRELEGRGFESELWSELAEMGVFGLRLAEADGGVGLGTADAISDLVSTGTTLRANHLRELEVLFQSQAALYGRVNNISATKKALLERLLARL